MREPAIFPGWLPWASAVLLAALCVGLVGYASTMRRQAAELSRKVAEAKQARADLQQEQQALQARVASIVSAASNDSARIAALEKQLEQKIREGLRDKADAEKKAEEAQALIISARRQLNVAQNQIAQSKKDLNRLGALPDAATLNQGNALDNLRIGLLEPTKDGPTGGIGSGTWEIHEQKGLLMVDNLPPLPPDRDYQLWLYDPKLLSPASGGVFGVSETGSASVEFRAATLIETVEHYAISIEPKGGVTAGPQGKVVMLSK